MRYTI